MNIKKFISIGLCTLTLSTALVFPTSAAKSADLKNKQIVSKVEEFNNSRLAKLRHYIWKTNYKFVKNGKVDVVRSLISLYKRLDNLVVSNVDVADNLCMPYNFFNPTAVFAIGGHVDLLIMFLSSIDNYGINQSQSCPFFLGESCPIFLTKNEINILNYRLNQIEYSNNKNNK